jgi:cobalt-precorrin 5A hydrolase
MFERGVAIVALTKWGISTSAKVAKAFEKAKINYHLYAPRQLCSGRVYPFDGDIRQLFAELFGDFDAIIAVMALGIVVRSVAPFIVNKKTDPAVVAVDDLGKYAVSLLSGHMRGANRLAEIVAKEIGAIPVVTTATELLRKKTVEEIAEEHNLNIVNSESLTKVNSAIVNEQKILVAAIGGVACPRIENADSKSISDINQLREMIKNYDAAIVLSPTILPLEDLTNWVALLTTKPSDSRGQRLTSNYDEAEAVR